MWFDFGRSTTDWSTEHLKVKTIRKYKDDISDRLNQILDVAWWTLVCIYMSNSERRVNHEETRCGMDCTVSDQLYRIVFGV